MKQSKLKLALFVVLTACSAALACSPTVYAAYWGLYSNSACTNSSNCESGYSYLGNSGGSLVQGEMGYNYNGGWVKPSMSFWVIRYLSSGTMDCYTNSSGEGYLIHSISNYSLSNGSYETTSYPYSTSFRLSVTSGTMGFNWIDENTLKPGVTYTARASYDRRHICSFEDDPAVTLTQITVNRASSWNLSVSVSVNKTTAKPGDTVTWTHVVANNGPDSTGSTKVKSRYWNANNSGQTWWSNGSTTGNESDDYYASNQVIRVPGTSKCLDVYGGSLSSGAKIEIWDCNGSGAQAFMISTRSNSIINMNSYRCVDIPNGNVSSGQALQQYTCNTSSAQKFVMYGDGTIRPTSNTGLCLDRPSGNTANGTSVQLWPCNGSSAQRWEYGTGVGRTFYSTYKIGVDDVDKTFCRRTSATPGSSSNSGWIDSSAACVYVPYDFNLEATTDVDPDYIYEDGVGGSAVARFSYTVKNKSSSATKSKKYRYNIYRYIQHSNGTTSTVISWEAKNDNSALYPGNSDHYSKSYSLVWPDYLGDGVAQEGDKVCSYIQVYPSDEDGNFYRSNTACTEVKNIKQWTTRGESTVNGQTGTIKVRPNKTVKFVHKLYNDGPEALSNYANIVAKLYQTSADSTSGRNIGLFYTSRAMSGYSKSSSPFFTSTSYTSGNMRRSGYSTSAVGSYETQQDDVGSTICQRMDWSPQTWTSSSSSGSTSACVRVPYHYPGCEGNASCTQQDNPPKDNCTFYNRCSTDEDRTTDNGAQPDVDHKGGSDAEYGDDITFNYKIRNDSGPTKTLGMEYHIYSLVVKGGETIANKDSSMAYGSFYDAACVSSRGTAKSGRGINVSQLRNNMCNEVASGTGVVVEPKSSFDPNNYTYAIENGTIQPGDQICSYIVIDKWSVYDDEVAQTVNASRVDCVKVTKKPQLQINGSDSYATLGFKSSERSFSKEQTASRGSYSQYGLLTGTGAIENFGTSGFTTTKEKNKANAFKLAFANSDSSSGSAKTTGFTLGKAGLTHTKLSMTVPTNATPIGSFTSIDSIIVNMDDLIVVDDDYVDPGYDNSIYYYSGNGTLTIGGGSINNDKNITIYAKGNVVITGNIYYDDVYGGSDNSHSLEHLPSLTIVSLNGNVSIASSVTEITGTYIATNGTFRSCNESTLRVDDPTLGTSGVCTRKLKINGAVYSKDSPELRRTFGSGSQDDPERADSTLIASQWDGTRISTTAEWFNYTPNTWLSSNLNDGVGASSYQTTMVTSLPVRY